MKEMLCNECEKRDECRKPCEAAREYADQDEKNQRELNVSDLNNPQCHSDPHKHYPIHRSNRGSQGAKDEDLDDSCTEEHRPYREHYSPHDDFSPGFASGWPGILRTDEARELFLAAFKKMSKREKQIVTFQLAGLNKKDICEVFDITPKNYAERLSQFKKKMKNRDVLPKDKGTEIMNEPIETMKSKRQPKTKQPVKPVISEEPIMHSTFPWAEDAHLKLDLQVRVIPGPMEVRPTVECENQEMVEAVKPIMDLLIMPIVIAGLKAIEEGIQVALKEGLRVALEENEKEGIKG